MAERTPEEIEAIKNAGKAFTPEEIAKGKAKRDAIWAREPVPPVLVEEVVAEAEEPSADTSQGAQGAPETEASLSASKARGRRRRAEPKPEVGQGTS